MCANSRKKNCNRGRKKTRKIVHKTALEIKKIQRILKSKRIKKNDKHVKNFFMIKMLKYENLFEIKRLISQVEAKPLNVSTYRQGEL